MCGLTRGPSIVASRLAAVGCSVLVPFSAW